MAFQSVPSCAEAVINCSYGAKDMVNVLGFKFSGTYALSDIQDLAAYIDSAVSTDYLPRCADNLTYLNTLCRGLELENDFSAVNADGAGAGGVTGAPLPANVSLCVTLRSGLTGRSARGRFYALPTGASNQVAVDTFNSVYIGHIEDFLNGIRTGAVAIGWELSVISRFHNLVKRPVGVPFKVVSIAARNAIMDSQRHRLPRGH